MAEMPTPPQPKTTTDEPGVTLAVLIAAPTPVMTPQPMSDAISSGTVGSMGTTACCGRTISSAKVPVPAKPKSDSSPRRKRGVMMALICTAEQRWGDLRSTQEAHSPHGGLQATITWSPSFTFATPSPTSAMTPAPSWPSTAGAGWGMVPVMPDRSEWHTPVAAMRTFTSPAWGPTTSTSSRISRFSSPV